MKKVITKLAVGSLLLTGMQVATTSAVAQQPLLKSNVQFHQTTELRAGTSPLRTSEYVARDINGKEYDINAILESGKDILIDICATW